MLSIVIPVYNELDFTKKIIDNISKTIFLEHEIVVVNDGSVDGTKDFLDNLTQDNVKVYHNTNEGVTYSWNFGISKAKYEYILVINNDILLSPGTVDTMIEFMKSNNDVGVLSPLEMRVNNPRNGQIIKKQNNIGGSCWMTTKTHRKKIGPIDERLKIWFNDDWIFYRLKDLGLKFMWNEKIIIHFVSQTVGYNSNHNPKVWNKIGKDRLVWSEILKENGWKDPRF